MGTHGTFTPPPGLSLVRCTCRGRHHRPEQTPLVSPLCFPGASEAYGCRLDPEDGFNVPFSRPRACQVPLADPAEGGLVVIGAVVFS